MRTITIDKLPEKLHHQVVIKCGERTHHQRMAVALERTLKRCSEIHAEYELKTVSLRENCQQQAFQAGFKLFFTQLVTMVDEYQRLQHQRQENFRQHLATALNNSLHDPMIVERIIHHLQEQCGHQRALRIIIPRVVKLPEEADTSNYQYSDDNHITVQNDMDAIRFPSDSLCRSWLKQADENSVAANETINQLIPNLLQELAKELLDLSQQIASSTGYSEQDEHHA